MPGRPMASNRRAYATGGQARYRNEPVTEPTSREGAAVSRAHPAVRYARTIFTTQVFDAHDRNHVLIEGINNAKIGNQITVGPWKGMRLYNLSLEERATCPRYCENFDTCFGNGSPKTARFHYNDHLMEKLNTEIASLSYRHRKRPGFAVRLHVLGDFPDVAYVEHWEWFLQNFPKLHVWGYTAWSRTSAIGSLIEKMNIAVPSRWRVRFSCQETGPHEPRQVVTTWTKPKQFPYDPTTGAMVCPQEIGHTDHCATCGICWNSALDHVRVTFLGHGGRGSK